MTEILSKEFSRTTFVKGGGAMLVGMSAGAVAPALARVPGRVGAGTRRSR